MTDDLARRVAAIIALYPGPEHAALRALITDMAAAIEGRDGLVGTLTVRLGQLEGVVVELQRAGKRQAAPFSKGAPSANPKKPGRKSGEDYGPRAHRAVPERIPDRRLAAPLPACCPDCGGEVVPTGESTQTIEDLAVTTVLTQVVVARGRCAVCHRHLQGRHPEQVSDALGAAGCQLGPLAQGLIAILAKECGLSHGKVSRILGQLGLSVTTGGVSGVLARLAAKAGPTYEALKKAVNASPAVTPDETGWRIGGWPGWLWVFATSLVTVYAIDNERSFAAASKVLDPAYNGVIVRDGWHVYPCYRQAVHQSCVAHLLRRAHGLIEAKARGSSTVPTMLRDLLVDALALRDRRDAGAVDPDDYETAVVALEKRLGWLLARRGHTEENRRLLKHLNREKDALLTFLRHEGVDATNWRAEQGVRPGVVNRKVWGGSRTPAGARTQERLTSVPSS